MRTITRTLLGAGLLLVVAATATDALAQVDATGTWCGSFVCKEIESGVITVDRDSECFDISQSGDVLRVYADGEDLLNGQIVSVTGSSTKGMFSMIHCNTTVSPVFFVTLAGTVKVNLDNGGGTMVGSLTSNEDGEIEVCDVHLIRVDTTDPGVPSCE